MLHSGNISRISQDGWDQCLEFGTLLQLFIIIIIIRLGCDSGQQGSTFLFYRKLTC
jgi:hypothetical protein